MASKEQQLPFGKIEPNSSKYFLSCALGGIVGKILHPSYSALGVMLTQRFSHLKHVVSGSGFEFLLGSSRADIILDQDLRIQQ